VTAASVRKRPRQERSRVTVQAILDAAAELFTRDGYAATSTNHVAARAGVSIGSLYQYFADKDELVAALAERHVDEAVGQLTAMFAALEREEAELDEVVRACVVAVIGDHLAAPELHRLLASAPRHKALEQALARARHGIAAALARRLRRAGAGGEDPELRALLLVEIVFALVHGALLDPPAGRSRDAVVREILALTLQAAHA